MNEHEFELTEEGKREVQSFITECKTKRNEVLDNAGIPLSILLFQHRKRFLMISIHKKMLMNVGVLLITMG